MSNPVQILLQNPNGAQSASVVTPGAGQPVRIKAQSGMVVELRDSQTQVAPDQVIVRRKGQDLEVIFGDGAQPDLVLQGYYDLEQPPQLVGLAENGQAYAYVPQDGQTASLASELADGASSYQGLGYDNAVAAVVWWPWVLGALLVGGVAAAAGGGGSSSSRKGGGDGGNGDKEAPDAPRNVEVNEDGTAISGEGEPGTKVVVRDGNGDVIAEGEVGDDGQFTVPLDPPRNDGSDVTVELVDDSGNVSDGTTVPSPDLTAPDAPDNVEVNEDGTAVSGEGEPGTKVVVRDENGDVIAEGEVNDDGQFTVPLDPPRNDGSDVTVELVDDSGNVSDGTTASTPDRVAPDKATDLEVINDGGILTGKGEPNAAVLVRNESGTTVGVGQVDGNGQFRITLNPPQNKGGELTVVLTDGSSNASEPATVQAPSIGPDQPTDLVVNNDGTELSGKGEAGTRVVVRDADGKLVAEGVVADDGTFILPLNPAQNDGRELEVTLQDDAGNSSPPARVETPDGQAPDAPDNVKVNEDGTAISGEGEPGTKVVVRDGNGDVIAEGEVGDDGQFTVPLDPPRNDGSDVTVELVDDSGNVSDGTTVPSPDLTAPDAPDNVEVNEDGTAISGEGEPGTKVVVRDENGDVIAEGEVGDDGQFTVPLDPPRNDGSDVTVELVDDSGNVSDGTTVPSPDLTAPDAPDNVEVNEDGTAVSGEGEPGTKVVVRDGNGDVIAEGEVGDDGQFTVPLDPPRNDGSDVTVELVDDSGNVSDGTTASTPDLTPPDKATNLEVIDDGATLVGKGEAGADVVVRDQDGAIVGRGQVDSSGNIQVTLEPAQNDGRPLEVTLTDDSGNTSEPAQVDTVDTTPPAPARDLSVDASGTQLTGKGEPGTQVSVVNAADQVVGIGIVEQDGTFTVSLSPAQEDGGDLRVTLTDDAGNASAPAITQAPMVGAPDAPTDLAIDDQGTVITGQGKAGARVVVRDPDNNEIGTAIVNPDGSFSVNLNPPQVDGETLTVRQVENNLPSLPGRVDAPDLTAPDAPSNLKVEDDGSALSGTGEPGAVVIIRDADGTQIAQGTVNASGRFTVPLQPAVVDGSELSVELQDASGNTSDPGLVDSPDLTAPAPAADLVVSEDGTTLTGRGEPGTQVRVVNADQQAVGTAVVNPDGTFTVTLSPAQEDGRDLSVTLTDASGNTSDPATAPTPDNLAPDAPENLLVSQDGAELSGTGEPGTTVTVTDSQNQEIGTGVVDADGRFRIDLDPPQTGGEQLSVTLTDPAGNQSEPGLVQAQYDIAAADNSVSLQLDVVPTGIDQPLQSKTSFAVAAVGVGILDLSALDFRNTLTLDVAENTQRQVTLKAVGGGVSVLSFFDLYVYKYNESSDQWQEVRVESGFLPVYLLGGASDELTVDLDEGRYMFVIGAKYGVNLLTGYTLETVADKVFDYTRPVEASGEVEGNVILDADPQHGADLVPEGSAVTTVRFGDQDVAVTADQPAVIEGQFGTLTLHADGSYTYVLSDAFVSNPQYGATERFTYTVTAPNGVNQDQAHLDITLNLGDKGEVVLADSVVILEMEPTTVAPTNEQKVNSITDFGLLEVGLGDLVDGQALNLKNSLQFTVDANTVRDLTFDANGGGVAIGNVYDLVIYRYSADLDKYVEYHVQSGWLNLPLFGGAADELPLSFTEGQYAATLRLRDGIKVLTGHSLWVVEGSDQIHDYNQPQNFRGEVSGDATPDEGDVLIRVDGQALTENGELMLSGEYGELVIAADGTYTYTARTPAAGEPMPYGKLDSFTYTVRKADGSLSVGTLNIRLDVVDLKDDSQSLTVQMEQRTSEVTLDDDWSSWAGQEQTRYTTFTIDGDPSLTVFDLDIKASSSLGGNFTLGYRLLKVNADGSTTEVFADQSSGSAPSFKLVRELNDLEPGEYRIEFSTSARAWNVVRLDVDFSAHTTYTDEYVEVSLPTVNGQLFANDLGSEAFASVTIGSKTIVIHGGIGGDSESVQIQGQYGQLTLNENGSYSYTPNGTGYGQEVFEYTVTSKIGTTDTARLVIDVNHDAPEGAILSNVTSPAPSGTSLAQDGSETEAAADGLSVPALSDLVSLDSLPALQWDGELLADAQGSAAGLPSSHESVYLADRLDDDQPDAASVLI